MIVRSLALSPESSPTRSFTTASGSSGTEPITTPATSASTNPANAASTQPSRSRVSPGSATGGTSSPVPPVAPVDAVMAGRPSGSPGRHRLRYLRDRASDDPQEVHHAWPPARRDVIVEFDNALVRDRGQLGEPTPVGDRLGRLAAALGIGEEDQIRVGVDQELG